MAGRRSESPDSPHHYRDMSGRYSSFGFDVPPNVAAANSRRADRQHMHDSISRHDGHAESTYQHPYTNNAVRYPRPGAASMSYYGAPHPSEEARAFPGYQDRPHSDHPYPSKRAIGSYPPVQHYSQPSGGVMDSRSSRREQSYVRQQSVPEGFYGYMRERMPMRQEVAGLEQKPYSSVDGSLRDGSTYKSTYEGRHPASLSYEGPQLGADYRYGYLGPGNHARVGPSPAYQDVDALQHSRQPPFVSSSHYHQSSNEYRNSRVEPHPISYYSTVNRNEFSHRPDQQSVKVNRPDISSSRAFRDGLHTSAVSSGIPLQQSYQGQFSPRSVSSNSSSHRNSLNGETPSTSSLAPLSRNSSLVGGTQHSRRGPAVLPRTHSQTSISQSMESSAAADNNITLLSANSNTPTTSVPATTSSASFSVTQQRISTKGGHSGAQGARVKQKKCKAEGCTKYAQSGGVCVSHGARVPVYHCRVEGCDNRAVTGGVCIAHGAKRKRSRCKVDGCEKYAQRGGMCKAHGGKLLRAAAAAAASTSGTAKVNKQRMISVRRGSESSSESSRKSRVSDSSSEDAILARSSTMHTNKIAQRSTNAGSEKHSPTLPPLRLKIDAKASSGEKIKDDERLDSTRARAREIVMKKRLKRPLSSRQPTADAAGEIDAVPSMRNNKSSDSSESDSHVSEGVDDQRDSTTDIGRKRLGFILNELRNLKKKEMQSQVPSDE